MFFDADRRLDVGWMKIVCADGKDTESLPRLDAISMGRTSRSTGRVVFATMDLAVQLAIGSTDAFRPLIRALAIQGHVRCRRRHT